MTSDSPPPPPFFQFYKLAPNLTSRHNNVGVAHGGFDVVFKGGFDKLVVLFEYPLYGPAPLRDVTLQTAGQADVGVSVNEHLHVHKLKQDSYIVYSFLDVTFFFI